MLLSLLLLPAGVALYAGAQRRRRALAERYGGFGLPAPSSGAPPLRRRLPGALYLLGFGLLGVAMARPQAVVNLPRLEGTLMLAFDVSASMAASDLAPTRMDVAKAAAEALVQARPSTAQIGVVAFSDGGLAVQVPTDDEAGILAAIGRLVPQRGTSLGEGMLAALATLAGPERLAALAAGQAPETLAGGPPAAIVLLSDGENNADPDPLAVAQAAAQLGVRVFTVGVGTPEGATLQLDGFSVRSRLDEAALRRIAELSGGAYYSVQDQDGLARIYDELAAQLVVRREETEVTALFAGAAMLLLLAGGLCSFLWFNRLA
jgi:Ca-activated chloride channel family protein